MTSAAQTATPPDFESHAALLRQDPLYLDRCQVDTPDPLVRLAWEQVAARRSRIEKVVDFGAGDARFSRYGSFDQYLGYEVDPERLASAPISQRVQVVNQCAFSHNLRDADLCIGNPPYVRNQDLPTGWRQMAAAEVEKRTGVALSGLANAWQYFLMLALSSVKDDGLVVQVVPYEWVSRPTAAPLRGLIESEGWSVDVYRLPDGIFNNVLTAAALTVIDKRGSQGDWNFHGIADDGTTTPMPSPTSIDRGIMPYVQPTTAVRARRGLSPGTQKVLTLSEGERIQAGLRVGDDVVHCVTSLRHVPPGVRTLDHEAFNRHFRDAGQKCWLIRTDVDPSLRLLDYLASVDEDSYQTATCLGRRVWWRFRMPGPAPALLVAQAFKGNIPKVVDNTIEAVAVGGVAGVYGVPLGSAGRLLQELAERAVHERLVPYAKQMHKLEINQLNGLLAEIFEPSEGA